ncbi:hypothetical protein CRG98_000530 [Punica granatum]|uniref:Myb-like domain-containing protein n=2 Tax=Punica granatum TaxID=22663 RepID=A0A2I0LEF5_PUNGR|nr:hypothetical protein CRG98_000530 [Punica granatum]
MASCFNGQSSKSEHISKENMISAAESTRQAHGSPIRHEEDEDEDEDIDFNPFLKETLSNETSSSLSSEVEGPEDADCNVMKPFHTGVANSSHLTDELQSCTLADSKHTGEELPLCTTVSQEEPCEEELQQRVPEASCQTENAIFQEEDHATKGGDFDGIFENEAAHGEKYGVLSDDDEDAICKRTRARYSLVSFTLDELESFLQETDDDEDLQNFDDEEEYKKFLAAVLLGGDDDGPATPENGNIDDEDEDNDADFEIELEEALDSDIDDRQTDKTQNLPNDRSRRRPETRQNRRRSISSGNKNKLLEQAKRPLRPLLPLLPVGQNTSTPAANGRSLTADVTPGCSVFAADSGYISGFTPYQIGQLYCLIHEHVQLLIQIYSLCILDPSKQQIASQVQELILEIVDKRDQVLARRNVPYPADLFRAPYLMSSVSDGSRRLHQEQFVMEPFAMNNAEGVNSASDRMEATGDVCPSNQHPENICASRAGSSQMFQGLLSVPIIDGPVLSILDVAPLNLVKNFMDDMSIAVREHRRRRVESSYDIRAEREPLFLLPNFLSAAQVNGDGVRGELPADVNKGPSSSSQPYKKSLAAALVETTKKQSVALVPKEVAKLAQKFFPLFNQALFPHKPPPASVTNRVLFTDAEDELLALGMMEYNTDWKAIQERFLPCKSKHQIFVRQKNRCSSKAPENPIKAVRRMKTSPLTTEEMKYIQEGLKFYKLDWMSVWRFIVPHRDPSLLPRQWRTALGTQKSYKQNALRKEKRRMYEAERRRRKAADLGSWPHGSEKEDFRAEAGGGGDNSSGDDCVDDPEEAYVHEAFLADWRPGISGPMPNQPQRTQITEPLNNQMAVEGQYHVGNIPQYITQSNHLQHPFPASLFSMNQPDQTNPRIETERLVKLAPNLPPVNLPRNVRVLSQSAYRTHQHVVKVGPICETRAAYVPDLHQEDSRVVMERSAGVGEERFNSTELQMHPLLFQVPVDGRLPYYPSNYTTSPSGSFSFFPGKQPQLNLSLFRSPNPMIHGPNSLTRSVTQDVNSTLSGIEFHPLLQRTDDGERNLQSSVRCDNNRGQLASGACPQSPLDKANELDLEIHLSSTSRKNKDLESRDKENLGVTFVADENSDPSCQPLENLPSAGALIERGSQELLNDFDQSYEDAVDDQSHPEIVMEQEELSDSEEEFEEQVEFECEEMADSEEEDMSGTELVSEASNKGDPNLPVEKVHIQPQDVKDQTVHKHCGSDTSAAGNSSNHPSFNLGCTPNPKDKKSSKSWLSLVSSHGEDPAVKKSSSSRPNRSCRKTKEPAKTETDSLTMPPIRRPRKRPCKNS